MLILNRQRDESIDIGRDVAVTVVEIRGDKVRLGITAPKSVPVHRREITQRIEAEASGEQGSEPRAEGATSHSGGGGGGAL